MIRTNCNILMKHGYSIITVITVIVGSCHISYQTVRVII